MRRHLAAGLGLGLLAGLAHACGNEGFACDGDEQCTLAGEPGRCVAGGRCAYPNPQCPSGLAYPEGAPAGLAGECVPDDAVASGTGGEGITTTEQSASAGASTGEPGDGSTSTGPIACTDDYEPNDTPEQASGVPFGGARGCQSNWEAALDDPLDADWFVLEPVDGTCPTNEQLTWVTDPPLELCVLPQCSDALAPEIVSCDGEVLPLTNGNACCAFEQLRVLARCGGALPPIMRLGVAASTDAPTCIPYRVATFL